MPSARKRIIYTHDDWDWDLQAEGYYFFSDQLPELYTDAINGTHDHLTKIGTDRHFTTGKVIVTDIDNIWDIVNARQTNSSSNNGYLRYTEIRMDEDPAVAWDNILTDSGGGFIFFDFTVGNFSPGKRLYYLTEGANAGNYSARWEVLWLNFWGMATDRTPITKRIYFPIGYSTSSYNLCVSETVSIYLQNSGDYPTSTAEAQAKQYSPGTLLYTFPTIASTGRQYAALDITTSVAAPVTLMITSTNQTSQPTIEDETDGTSHNREAALLMQVDSSHYAKLVQYYGWVG